jgi:hypothetical protein
MSAPFLKKLLYAKKEIIPLFSIYYTTIFTDIQGRFCEILLVTDVPAIPGKTT